MSATPASAQCYYTEIDGQALARALDNSGTLYNTQTIPPTNYVQTYLTQSLSAQQSGDWSSNPSYHSTGTAFYSSTNSIGALAFNLNTSGTTTYPGGGSPDLATANVNMKWLDTYIFHTTRAGGSDVTIILDVHEIVATNLTDLGNASFWMDAYLDDGYGTVASFSDSTSSSRTNYLQKVTLHVTDGQVLSIDGRLQGSATSQRSSVSLSATERVYVYSIDPLCTISSCSGLGALQPATTLSATVSGGILNLSWPVDALGWQVQSQTNPLSIGISTNWATIAGTGYTNLFSVPVDSTAPAVFYRLVYPSQ